MLGLTVRVVAREWPGRCCEKVGVAGVCGVDGPVELGLLTWVATLEGRGFERVRRIEDFLELRRDTFGRPSKQFMASIEGRSRSWDTFVDVVVGSVKDGRGINEWVEFPECFPVCRDVERDRGPSEAAICSSRRCCSSWEKCCRRTFSGSDKNHRASALETSPVPKQSTFFARGRRRFNEAPELRMGNGLVVERA
jgi:hypothetical protein